MSRRSRFVVAALLLSAVVPTVLARAGAPAGGTVSVAHPQVRWSGAFPAGFTYGEQILAASLLSETQVQPNCPPAGTDPQHLVCDHFRLTVDVPASYWRSHHGGVKVSVSYPDPGNKIELAAFDSKGRFITYGLNSDPVSLVLPSAHGTYDIVIDPLIVPHQTAYTGLAKIVRLPVPSAHPSLGGPAAYRAVRVAAPDPDAPPANTPVHYRGPALRLYAHPTGVLTQEPTLGVDRKRHVYMNAVYPSGAGPVAGYGTYGYPPFLAGSTDGGRHWHHAESLAAGLWESGSDDPYMYLDPDTGRVFWLNLDELYGTNLSFTDDGGASWTNTLITKGGVNDHPTLVTGVVPKGSPLVTVDPKLPKIVYYCANGVTEMGCDRSLDGGVTFVRTSAPFLDQAVGCAPAGVESGHMTTDRDGRVFVGAGNCGIPEVSVSTDAAGTWQESQVSRTIHTAGHDVEVEADAAGTVYALWEDDQNFLPYLAVSRDHGRTWGTPMMVAPPGVHGTTMLTLTTGSAGRVAVGMVTTTVDNVGDLHRPWSYRIAVTQNATAARPLFVSNVATLPDRHTAIVDRGDCCMGMKDFLDLKTAPLPGGPVWGSLGVVCTGRCVTDPHGVNDEVHTNKSIGYAVEEVSGPALVGPARALPRRSPAH